MAKSKSSKLGSEKWALKKWKEGKGFGVRRTSVCPLPLEMAMPLGRKRKKELNLQSE